MAVEKFNRTIHEHGPYTQICNEIIEHIKNSIAFHIYAYLYSKTEDWEVIKEHLMKFFKIGENKLDKIFSYFNRCGLISYIRLHDELGRYIGTDILVRNGTEFDKNVPFLPPKTKKNKLSTEKPHHSHQNHRHGHHGHGPEGLLKKEVTKERKKLLRKKEKSFYEKSKSQKLENAKKHDFAESMNKNASEKKHIEKHNKIKEEEMTYQRCGKEYALNMIDIIKNNLNQKISE